MDFARRLTGPSARERRLRAAGLAAFAAGFTFAILSLGTGALGPVQGLVSDELFSVTDDLFGAGAPSPAIVLVGITDEDLQTYGRLQDWPRTLHAEAISAMSEAGAGVIAYDIIFADESPEDAELRDAIEAAGNVILPVSGDSVPGAVEGGYRFQSFVTPTSRLAGAAAALAHANLIEDGDGTVRKIPLSVFDQSSSFVPLSLAAMYLQFGSEVPAAIDASGGSLSLFGRTIPLEEHGAMRINYSGGNERFTAFSFGQVLSRDVPSLQGRIIFVGVLATASDIRSSPQGSTYGMVIQASALDTLLRADFLRRTGGFVTLVITMAFVLLSAVVVPRWRPAYSLLLVIALGGAYIAAGIILFDSGWIVDMVHPPAALLLTTLVGLSYTVVSARAAQRDMQELFGRYLSPQVAHALIERADRGQLHLGGELREVSVLFGDIRGFTPLTARTPPQELVAMLNQHFAVIISRIMENGGIVNKFAGDAVMALWNAPEDQPEHALSACRAALQAQSDLGALSDVVKWGFGISTGVALAGNVGSGRRLEYTVIGDSVNLAARLCGVAPAGEVWISEETYGRVETTLPAEALPPQPIKGFDAPVAAYRLKMGAEPAPAPASVEGG